MAGCGGTGEMPGLASCKTLAYKQQAKKIALLHRAQRLFIAEFTQLAPEQNALQQQCSKPS